MPDEVVEQPERTDFQNYEALPEAEREAAVESATAEGEAAAAEPKPAEAKPAKPAEAKPAEAAKPAEVEGEEEVPHGLRKRFRELTTKIRELEARQPAPPPAVAAPPPAAAAAAGDAEPVKPDLTAWTGTYAEYEVAHEKYLREMVRFETKRVASETQRATEQAALDTHVREAKAKWEVEKEAARDTHDDFDEIALHKDLPVTQVMFEAMRESEHCTEILYHLGMDAKNGGDASAKIAAMSPIAQARAIARLETKLFPDDEAGAAAATEKKPAISRAPAPPRLVRGAGVADLGKEPDPKDFKAWSKWKDKQERAEAEAA
jgi:hypothetical protein